MTYTVYVLFQKLLFAQLNWRMKIELFKEVKRFGISVYEYEF